jgi:hypothetical protein
MQGESRAEQVLITVKQCPATVDKGSRPRLPGVARPGLEQREGPTRRGIAGQKLLQDKKEPPPVPNKRRF